MMTQEDKNSNEDSNVVDVYWGSNTIGRVIVSVLLVALLIVARVLINWG